MEYVAKAWFPRLVDRGLTLGDISDATLKSVSAAISAAQLEELKNTINGIQRTTSRYHEAKSWDRLSSATERIEETMSLLKPHGFEAVGTYIAAALLDISIIDEREKVLRDEKKVAAADGERVNRRNAYVEHALQIRERLQNWHGWIDGSIKLRTSVDRGTSPSPQDDSVVTSISHEPFKKLGMSGSDAKVFLRGLVSGATGIWGGYGGDDFTNFNMKHASALVTHKIESRVQTKLMELLLNESWHDQYMGFYRHTLPAGAGTPYVNGPGSYDPAHMMNQIYMHWITIDICYLQAVSSFMLLDANAGSSAPYWQQLRNDPNNPNLKWRITPAGGGYYHIIPIVNPSVALYCVADSGRLLFMPVKQGESNQMWRFEDRSGGGATFECLANGRHLNTNYGASPTS